MLKVFLRDRGFDFEFFVFTDNQIKYEVENTDKINDKRKELYRSLNMGTILLDDFPISVDNVTEEQIEYIKNIINLFKEKITFYKSYYKPYNIRYTSGNDAFSMFVNEKQIELPNPRQFTEWAHIKGFEYLERFYNEYKKQNSLEVKVRKKVMNFFHK